VSSATVEKGPAAEPRQSTFLVIAGSTAGTIFEWYDFFIFGSLTTVIAAHFYSNVGEARAFLFALLTFAAGFAVRPIGALVFGHVGDRVGRKRAFLITISFMGLATFSIGLLPDYRALGVTAAFILIGLRFLQGFAVGGEYGGAAIYVAEHASAKSRGLATSWIQISASVGLVLALGVILVTRTLLGETVFAAWGWRLPFLGSVLLLILSVWIRLRIAESPVFRKLEEENRRARQPLAEAFLRWPNLKLVLLVLVGLLMSQGVVWYTAEFYTLFFLQNVIKVDAVTVNLLLLVASAIGILLHGVFGWISDFIGRKPVMLFGLALAALTFVPAFPWLAEAANPALTEAAARSPVTVSADPANCSLQFDLVGKTKFVSACDIAKSALANAGIPYLNKVAAGPTTVVTVGDKKITSPDGRGLSAAQLKAARALFETKLKSALAAASYPLKAPKADVDEARVLAILVLLIGAAAALYGPQAAALVEFFPARIRYSALSLPYHVGVGWFGGFLPAIAFALVTATGNIYAGAWYPAIVAAIGFFVTLFFLPETRGRDISV